MLVQGAHAPYASFLAVSNDAETVLRNPLRA
jgi:hypothetical protein